MSPRAIASISWGLPANWVGWSHGESAAAAAEIDVLGEDATTSAAVAAAVEEFEETIAEHFPGTWFAALWVPEARRRQPLATALLRVAAPPPEGRLSVEDVVEAARDTSALPRTHKMLDIAALPGRVSSGDAVLRVADTAPRFSRRVTREWTWFLLPPGTDRMLLCQVEASSIAHFDVVGGMAHDIADGVEIELGAP